MSVKRRNHTGKTTPVPPRTVPESGGPQSRERDSSSPERTILETPPDRIVRAPKELAAAEEAVAVDWKEGDVILDLYEVKGLLGEGGMGKVYKVHHRGWNLDLAVKSPRQEALDLAGGKENFVREAETWIDLGLHPHVVTCHYVRTLGGVPRVFAEYVEGGSLAHLIRTRKLYEGGAEEALKRLLEVAIQFAWGLQYAHEKGLVHQDVKPANVMLTPDGVAKVTDFGLARARAVGEAELADGKGGTVIVEGVGMTPEYCSPEQAGGRPLTRRTDVWSWALSVLEMFVGERTWASGLAAPEVLRDYLRNGPADESIPRMPTQDAEQAGPGTLAALLEQCFRIEPDERPRDMAEIVARLRDAYREDAAEDYARPEPKPAELLADGLNNRAVTLLDLGKREEAEKLFEEALAFDPHHPEATYNRGLVLWRSGRLADDALVKQLEEVRTSHLRDWRDDYYLGLVHMERGEAEAAVQVLEEAASMAADESEVERALGTARSGRKNWRSCVRALEGHTAPVNCVAFSPDRRWAISGSSDTTLRLWELATGKCVRVLEGHTAGVLSVAISADGRWGVSGSGDGTMRVWDLASGECVRVFEDHKQPVTEVAITKDGRRGLSTSGRSRGMFVAPSTASQVQLWDLATGERIREFGVLKSLVAVSGDPRRWLSVETTHQGRAFEFRLLTLAAGKCVQVFEWLKDFVPEERTCWEQAAEPVALSPNGSQILCGWKDDDRVFGLVDLATKEQIARREQFRGVLLQVFEGHTERVDCVAISRDGRWAISGSRDQTLRLWEMATGKCVRVFKGHTERVNCVAISRDGRSAVSGSSDKTLRLWKSMAVQPAPFAVSRPRSVVEVSHVAVQASEAIEGARALLGQGRAADAADLLVRARRLAGYERHPELLHLLQQAGSRGKRVDLVEGWCVRSFTGHTEAVHAAAVSPDGRRALSGSDDKTLRLWELATGECVRVFRPGDYEVDLVTISPDGRWALSEQRTYHAALRQWELATGEHVREFSPGVAKRCWPAAISPDQRWALATSTIHASLWDRRYNREKPLLGHHRSWLEYAAVRSKRSGANLMLWDLVEYSARALRQWDEDGSRLVEREGRLLGARVCWLEGHTGTVRSMAISPDGRWALSGGDDKTLRLWNLATGECARVFQGHEGAVHSVAFSPDARWLLSGSEDKTLRLWNLATGECVREFQGHKESVYSVAISPDARWLLSGSADKTLRLWELIWDYEFPEPVGWNEDARPYLEIFLTLCQVQRKGLFRRRVPTWTEDDFQRLLADLQRGGYGWLRPEGVRLELDKMTREWKGPPPLAP